MNDIETIDKPIKRYLTIYLPSSNEVGLIFGVVGIVVYKLIVANFQF